MSTTRQLTLFACAVLTIAAATGPVAHAQESAVAVKTEAGGVCNPCVVHSVGEFSFFAGAIELSRCREEFTFRIYTTGIGEIEWLGLADAGPGCNASHCTQAPENHWGMQSMGETTANVAHVTILSCFNGVHCAREYTIREPMQHRYTISANQTCPNGVRVTSSAAAEGTLTEIDHTP